MSPPANRSRQGLYALLGAGLLAVGGAFWLPRWWETRLYRQAEALTGVGAPVLSGTLTDARKKIDPGQTEKGVVAALGGPSVSQAAEGSSSHGIWIYYYADGTMTINLTDGVVVRIGVSYGPPKIPTSGRP